MPIKQPVRSWFEIRNYAERWQWQDPRTGVMVTGFNAPKGAKKKAQVPYYLRCATLSGDLIEGRCITLKVLPLHQRMVKFVDSGEIRRICDYLIISIDGIRFVTH